MIAVGGADNRAAHGHCGCKHSKKMIKIPVAALAAEDEGGQDVTPEVGDMVALDMVEGEIRSVSEDGMVHVELKTAGGEPIEYADDEKEEKPEEPSEDAMEAELMAAAEKADEEEGY